MILIFRNYNNNNNNNNTKICLVDWPDIFAHSPTCTAAVPEWIYRLFHLRMETQTLSETSFLSYLNQTTVEIQLQCRCNNNNNNNNNKGKFPLRTGHEGPERDKRYSCTLSLTSASHGVGCESHLPTPSPPGKKAGIHCLGGWVGPRAGLDGCVNSRHHRDSIPWPSSPQRVAITTELSQPQ